MKPWRMEATASTGTPSTSCTEVHDTPSGSEQEFVYCYGRMAV